MDNRMKILSHPRTISPELIVFLAEPLLHGDINSNKLLSLWQQWVVQCHGHQIKMLWYGAVDCLHCTLHFCKNEHILYEFGIDNEIIYSILFTPMCGCMSVVGRANAVKSCLFRWPATTGPRSPVLPSALLPQNDLSSTHNCL